MPNIIYIGHYFLPIAYVIFILTKRLVSVIGTKEPFSVFFTIQINPVKFKITAVIFLYFIVGWKKKPE